MRKFLFALLFSSVFSTVNGQLKNVHAVHETDDVTSYNSADDPAIYLHPTNSDSSFFIGTDKASNGRLELYNMDGSRFWSTPAGKSLNNVDVLYGFPLGGDTVDIVGATNRTHNRLEMYVVDDASRSLINSTGSTSAGLTALYGFTFYKDVCNGKYYAFITLKNSSGFVYQFELTDSGSGTIDATLVRQILNLPTRTEGMVVDQVLGHLYVAEEVVGVWKYDADPAGGSSRVLMDTIGGVGHLSMGIEGIAMYYSTDSTGYVLVSSQSTSTFQVYEREGNNAFVGEFAITAGVLPECYKADGIDVLSFPISSTYPNGVFISHDNAPNGQYTNYITVPWESIADSIGLDISLTKDPRKIGENYCDTVSGPNGIDSIDSEKRIVIYPNPFIRSIAINGIGFKKEKLVILNVLGEVLLVKTVSSHENIDLSHFKQGVYFVQIGTSITRIVKSE